VSIRFAIVIYRCEVDGKRTDSLDVQVRYFGRPSTDIEFFLRSETTHSYRNIRNEEVAWHFVRVASVEELRVPDEGQEVAGFIAGCKEFVEWARLSH
jgi:hypothetical protein